MKKGFTLIELSIVLVIIGVIMAGVVIGTALINAARIQAIITDFQKYKVAKDDFFKKYGALPGDMADAANYWEDPLTSAPAVNGDGDGIIELDNTGAGGTNERPNFWNHLGLSQFIAGSYGTVNNYGPVTQLPTAYFFVNNDTIYTSVVGNFFILNDKLEATGVLNGRDAYSIDLKIDDGSAKLTTGTVFGIEPAAGECLNGSDDYDLSTSHTNCAIYFRF